MNLNRELPPFGMPGGTDPDPKLSYPGRLFQQTNPAGALHIRKRETHFQIDTAHT